MASRNNIFTTIRTEGALLPADLLQRISEGANLDGLTPESYHRPGEKLNEVVNRSWNVLQGAWTSFRAAQQSLPESDLGTSITRERWLLPLFRELDYGRLQTATAVEIDGRSYPISHGWEHVPVHLVSYKLELDRRTPGAAGAASASPHSLLQVFLNRSENNLWGFLSNGYKLRILRDNASLTRQAYVEFDLEAMMDGEVYSDFVLLWLLCHQSRVEGEKLSDCWLEKWMKVAEDQGTRALDQLRDGVEAAITALGLGFLEYPANHTMRGKLTSGELSAQDYYRQLLRMVYRLLFLFVAEDRNLLLNPAADTPARERYIDYYSTQRLRRMAETFKGTRHPDLFEGLRLVMRLLSGDNNGAGAGLGLVPLGSFLFSDSAVADVIDCQIANSHLLDAIRALSLTYDQRAQVYRTVDYKNLGSDELGSIFESLLELHPQINVPARRFALSTAAGNERKTTGSYYTPESLVHALLDSALNPVLAEATKKGEAAILDLKVCDPACGSGHFLIAAANRMAKALAFVRTGEEEPPPAAIQEAKRDIISHCIYGVDINPMAVELCKVNLWMEALEPGKPLNFLDHRIQVGNSLLGTTPKLMAGGIPDDAFNPIEGDDKKFVSGLRNQNKKERSGQTSMFADFDAPLDIDNWKFGDELKRIDKVSDDTLDDVRRQEAYYRQMAQSEEYVQMRLKADAWCAAFVWEKHADAPPPMTEYIYRLLFSDPYAERLEPIISNVFRLSKQYQFFHWHIAFPDVFEVSDNPNSLLNEQTGWHGGFDCVLGNPPWERIKIQEKEWFAERAPEIANAPNAAARRRAIAELAEHDPDLLQAFADDKRKAEGESHFVRVSERYPLCGRGDVNTYTIFAETSRHIINSHGRVGMIVPSGIATDDTTKFFFQDLMRTRSLTSLYDFENREGLFPAVHREQRFCLLTVTGFGTTERSEAQFIFFAYDVAEILDPEKRFTLSAKDIALINPNTGTTATFRNARSAEVTKTIYRNIPVLLDENDRTNNPWGVSLASNFHMTNDSHLFHSYQEIANMGFVLKGNIFYHQNQTEIYIALLEGKLTQIFDHRSTTFLGVPDFEVEQGNSRPTKPDEYRNPHCYSLPRSWVKQSDFLNSISKYGLQRYWLTFHDVANPNNERTFIATVCPFLPLGNTLPFFLFEDETIAVQASTGLYANLNMFIFDYVSRLKISSRHFNFFIVKQLPVIPPHTYTPDLLDFIVPRVLELSYTAWDLQPFAQDVGYSGAPFIWDEQRRFLMRCELDALYFHLYQISRDDVDYIMETFPIVKRKDEASYGTYRTKDTILSMYDQMAALPIMHVPAPKDESAIYAVPDISQWVTWLNPPPADPGVAHPDTRG